jgi:hypothetical protein
VINKIKKIGMKTGLKKYLKFISFFLIQVNYIFDQYTPEGKWAPEKNENKNEKRKLKSVKQKGLNAKQIDNSLYCSPSYLGAIDMITFKNIIVNVPCFFFVVNCFNHWFSIYYTPKTFEIFDSLGFLETKGCISHNLLKFVAQRIGHKELKTTPSLQSETSTLCGIYFVNFIRQRDQGYTFDQILKKIHSENKNKKQMIQFI